MTKQSTKVKQKAITKFRLGEGTVRTMQGDSSRKSGGLMAYSAVVKVCGNSSTEIQVGSSDGLLRAWFSTSFHSSKCGCQPIVREARFAKLLRCSYCTARLSRMCSPSLSPSGSISSIACCMVMTRSAPRPDTRYGTVHECTILVQDLCMPVLLAERAVGGCRFEGCDRYDQSPPTAVTSTMVLVRGSVWKCRCHASSNFRVTQCDSVQTVGAHLLPFSSLGLYPKTAI